MGFFRCFSSSKSSIDDGLNNIDDYLIAIGDISYPFDCLNRYYSNGINAYFIPYIGMDYYINNPNSLRGYYSMYNYGGEWIFVNSNDNRYLNNNLQQSNYTNYLGLDIEANSHIIIGKDIDDCSRLFSSQGNNDFCVSFQNNDKYKKCTSMFTSCFNFTNLGHTLIFNNIIDPESMLTGISNKVNYVEFHNIIGSTNNIISKTCNNINDLNLKWSDVIFDNMSINAFTFGCYQNCNNYYTNIINNLYISNCIFQNNYINTTNSGNINYRYYDYGNRSICIIGKITDYYISSSSSTSLSRRENNGFRFNNLYLSNFYINNIDEFWSKYHQEVL